MSTWKKKKNNPPASLLCGPYYVVFTAIAHKPTAFIRLGKPERETSFRVLSASLPLLYSNLPSATWLPLPRAFHIYLQNGTPLERFLMMKILGDVPVPVLRLTRGHIWHFFRSTVPASAEFRWDPGTPVEGGGKQGGGVWVLNPK